MDDELLDWEVLHGSDSESTDSIAPNEKSRSSSVIDDGMILSDHFSAVTTTDSSQSGLIEPGDSSRVDYGSEPPVTVDLSDACVRNELVSSEGGGVRLSDFEADDGSKCLSSESDDLEVSDGMNIENQSGVEDPIQDSCKSCSESGGNELVSGDSEIVNGQDEIVSDESKCLFKSDDLEVGDGRQVENQSGVEEPIEDLSKSWSDSGGNELVSGDSEIVNGEEEIVSSEEVEAVGCGDESESKSREIVWWKMPFVLLKYSVFKIGPVWSVSMAAAVMGLVLLGRRLYNMKKKAQRFHLKVTIDDKKVSRVMSQAARLNEVFTEVRRVPVIRSALPSPVAWPVLSLR